MNLPQLASQPVLPLALLAAGKGSAAHGKHSSADSSHSDTTRSGGSFAQLIAKAAADTDSSKTLRTALQHPAKQVSSKKTPEVAKPEPGSAARPAAPIKKNVLAQLLAAQSSTARGSQVSGKPTAQAAPKGEASDQSGNPSVAGKTASQTAPVSSNGPQTKEFSPVGQMIVVRGLPFAQAEPKGDTSGQSEKPSVGGKTASQTAPVSSNSP
ncbi:MAG TPA: hypothetical protein VF283_00330, partial [Bryobacteraceae bacterium]